MVDGRSTNREGCLEKVFFPVAHNRTASVALKRSRGRAKTRMVSLWPVSALTLASLLFVPWSVQNGYILCVCVCVSKILNRVAVGKTLKDIRTPPGFCNCAFVCSNVWIGHKGPQDRCRLYGPLEEDNEILVTWSILGEEGGNGALIASFAIEGFFFSSYVCNVLYQSRRHEIKSLIREQESNVNPHLLRETVFHRYL